MNKHYIAKTLLSIGFFSFVGCGLFAQNAQQHDNYHPILTGMPSMNISPDAVGAGLGDQGTSTLPDIYSQYWNPAKYAFIQSSSGVDFTYTPWLSRIVSDVALLQLGGYYKIDDNQAIGSSLRYFTLGKVQDWDRLGQTMTEASPNEFAIDLSYSRKLSSTFSMAVALRYLRADQNTSNDTPAGNAIAADVAGYLNQPIDFSQGEGAWTFGFNIRNIGTKISNDGGNTKNFLPTNLGLGSGLLYPFDKVNSLQFNVELNKLLVPIKPVYDGDETSFNKANNDYNEMSSIAGIFHSLYDAPNGFSEVLQTIRWSLGAQYVYDNKFILRTGYSYINPNQSNLQGFTFGAGFKFSGIQLDASYLVSTIANNPLDQTLRFSLSVDMDGIKSLLQ